jgi:hypothetical protein
VYTFIALYNGEQGTAGTKNFLKENARKISTGPKHENSGGIKLPAP